MPHTPVSQSTTSSTHAPSTFSSTLGSQLSSDFLTRSISPLLATMLDQQTLILTNFVNFDRTLRDLATKVGKLNKAAKKKEKEREAKEKAREQREKAHLKALILLTQRVDGVRKVDGRMLDRLDSMDVEEWLKAVMDSDAAGKCPPP